MISTLGWICICFFLIVFKYAFLKPVEDKRIYAMYAARDSVALAAIEGKISQKSEEYKFVIRQINFEIYYMKNNYDFSILFKNLFLRPEIVKEYFDSRYKLIQNYNILSSSLSLSFVHFQESLKLRTVFFIYLVIKPYYYFLSISLFILELFEQLTNLGDKFVDILKKNIMIVKDIDAGYANFRQDYMRNA